MQRTVSGANDLRPHPCALCRGDHFTPLYSGQDAYSFPVRLAACDCGLVQLNPRLSSEALEQFYAGDEYSRTYIAHRRVDAEWRTRKETVAAELLDAVAAQRAVRGARLFDVGCGDGMLLTDAKRRGAIVAGVEPGRDQAERLQKEGFEVTAGTLRDIQEPRPTFDIVTLSHVLEHVDDVVAFLTACRELLDSHDSVLAVEVPDLEFYLTTGLIREGVQAAHVSYFTVDTLRDALDRAGLVGMPPSFSRRGDRMRIIARLGAGVARSPAPTGAMIASRVRRVLKWSSAYKTAYVASHPRTWQFVARRAIRGRGAS